MVKNLQLQLPQQPLPPLLLLLRPPLLRQRLLRPRLLLLLLLLLLLQLLPLRRKPRSKLLLQANNKAGASRLYFISRQSGNFAPGEPLLLRRNSDPTRFAIHHARECLPGKVGSVVLATQVSSNQMLQTTHVQPA